MPVEPLAVRMRPQTLSDVVGQEHLIFPGSPLEVLTTAGTAVSVLMWGPPGCGKTTLARIIAESTNRAFVELSATSSGVKDVRQVLDDAEKLLNGDIYPDPVQTVVFIDEIHRFSKTQQDVLLPAVESGKISLIGATTENPSFSVNSALASRTVLMVLRQLGDAEVAEVVRRAVADPRGLGGAFGIDDDAAKTIARLSSGDARQALNRLETASQLVAARGGTVIDVEAVDQVAGTALQRYDRDGDQHYDVISAFIKSLRGSDPDAAVHWLFRMIEAGEDPRYIARRLMVHASEDVGMADPTVLPLCVAAAQAVQMVGLPEAEINLTHATIALACAPKSNAVIRARSLAKEDVARGRTGPVPYPLRDAHYPGAKQIGHGAGYLYPHDYPGAVVAQQYLPDEMVGTVYYEPTERGAEKDAKRRLLLNQIQSIENQEDA